MNTHQVLLIAATILVAGLLSGGAGVGAIDSLRSAAPTVSAAADSGKVWLARSDGGVRLCMVPYESVPALAGHDMDQVSIRCSPWSR